MSASSVLVKDFVAPGFELVRQEFLNNFQHRREIGATCVVYHKGKVVVDLAGGVRDVKTRTPYTPDTLQVVFSSTKVLEGLVIAMLVDRGLLDYNEPVAKYWPEFAQNGKEHITVRQLMRHQAGLVGLDEPLELRDLLDLDSIAERLAKQQLFWVPRDERDLRVADPNKTRLPTRQGYHAISRGFYANELVRRVAKMTLGQFAQKEIAGPLGIEFFVGLPESYESRVAPLYSDNKAQQAKWLFPQLCLCSCLSHRLIHPGDKLDSCEMLAVMKIARALSKPVKPGKRGPAEKREVGAATLQIFTDFLPMPLGPNKRIYRQVENPSANGVTNASGIAKLAALLANGGELDGLRLLSPSTFQIANEVSGTVFDECLGRRVSMCTAGWGGGAPEGCNGLIGLEVPLDNTFAVNTPEFDSSLNGWGGAGGSLFCWSTKYKVAIGYAMNRMGAQLVVDRQMYLKNAVAASIINLNLKK
eukprot:c7382_g1_i1.p1 GENE.c7382_g1_i1~~c7382_g1_i1.p1  ORF type:complete len:493 (-),score=120.25 c7382_g1_i1:199-1617(-)